MLPAVQRIWSGIARLFDWSVESNTLQNGFAFPKMSTLTRKKNPKRSFRCICAVSPRADRKEFRIICSQACIKNKFNSIYLSAGMVRFPLSSAQKVLVEISEVLVLSLMWIILEERKFLSPSHRFLLFFVSFEEETILNKRIVLTNHSIPSSVW